MKRALTLLAALWFGAAYAAIDFKGVEALAFRMGKEALTSKLSFEEIADKSVEKAQIVPNGDGATFTIKATSVHAASLAMGVYLRDVAKGHISWCGKRMPTEWAVPTETINVQARYSMAMAYNYCTLSYTMAYWSKEAWQNEIDRLALSGYNTALCMAGVQKIWKLTMAELGYTEQQQHDFIVDDAQQAWWLMGNLQAIGNGTPQGHFPVVSDEEIERDAEIGKFIVKQMRAVGIEPVLQSFIGLVPSSTTKTQLVTYLNNHPDVCSKYEITDKDAAVKIFVNGYYNEGHKNPDLIDPNCKIFQVFSDVWNENLKKAYGMDDETPEAERMALPKYLGGDLFHESSPPGSLSVQEQVNCAAFIQKYQKEAFPDVTWVLQNWQSAPVQNLRNGLDPEHTIIQRLDQTMSSTEARTASYKNNTTGEFIPWVWVEVMNFGGNTGMHGAFRRFRNVGNLGGNNSFKGYGLLSEGLETNPISYDMYHWAMAKTTQAEQNIDDNELEPWMAAYRERRYGITDAENNGSASLKAAYTIFANTVWTCTKDQQGTVESIFCAKPAYNVAKVSAWGPTTGTPYEPAELILAARHMLEAATVNPDLLDLETFRYDFVEVFQQILADHAREIIADCATSRAKRNEFRKMLELLDQILACSDEWRLDKKEARLIGKAPTTGPAAYRRLITTWTPGQRGQTQLSQYAHRSYAGLVKNYYAKKWNAFFDVTEGNMTSAAYTALCSDLDANFPYTTLPAMAEANTFDIIQIANDILDVVNPPALTWTNAAGNNRFEDANWKNNKNETVAWEDGMNAILSGYGTTISASTEVRVGNISFERYQLPANLDAATYLNKTEEQVVFNNLTLETLHNSPMTATMGGSGWFGINGQPGKYRSQPATGYFKSAITGSGEGSYFTVNFQCLDDGWVKATTVKFIQRGETITAITTGCGAKSNGTLGAENLTTGTTASADSNGYGIKAFNYLAPSKLSLDGAVTVEGAITLDDSDITVKRASMIGGEIAINGGTLTSVISSDAIVSRITVGEKGGTIVIPNNCNMTINAIAFTGDKKLVLKGNAETLKGLDGTMLISIPRDCVSKVVYVCSSNPSEEQALKLDTNGYLKTKIGTLSYNSFVTATATKTEWKNVTLSDLAECEFTGTMGGNWVKDGSNARGYLIEKTADAVTFLMQKYDTDNNTKSVKITLTIGNDGFVYIKASEPKYTPSKNVPGTIPTTAAWQNNTLAESATAEGYGVASVTITPAVAQVAGIVSNYSTLTDAITAANGAQKVTLLDDATVSTAINNNFKTWLEVPRGVTLSATCGDFIYWNKAYTLDIYGTLDLGSNVLSYSAGYTQTINVYAGGVVRSTHAKGFSVFGTSTINVKAAEGADTVTLDIVLQAREAITLNVEAGVTAKCLKKIETSLSNDSGSNHTVTKTGAGTMEFEGAIANGCTLILSEGKLKRVMPDKDTLTVTINGGTTEILPIDEDHKIVEEVNGSVHTFTCKEKHYVYRVTVPGAISVNLDGVNYETFEEALAAAIASQAANSQKEVKLWVLSQEDSDAVTEFLKEYNTAHSTKYELFGNGDGIAVMNWNKNIPGEKPPFEDVLAIVGRLAGGYNGAEAEGLDKTKANEAMAKFEFVQVADTVVAKGAAKVDNNNGKIRIQASDASGASYGLGQYLRNTAKMHISWCGNRVTDVFPLPTAPATYTPAIPVRFAYNYCTLSYTMAFWSAKEWREEIDRLALSGYNVALVLQGLQEAWRVTLESVHKANGDRVYEDEMIMKYVSDEAAQAWWHMGNLEGLGGPLGSDKGQYSAPDAYAKFTARTKADAVLGEYIYAEMMKLGIQPSIQSFVGLVPDCSNGILENGVDSNGTRFGAADNWGIINEGAWQGYTRPDVVNPLNIAFDEMSKYWYGALVSIYKPEVNGYTSYMGGDLFHEGGNKGSLTDANLADIAKKIQDTQAQYFGNNGANTVTWVIQSWQGSPYQGIRNGLDTSKAIIQLLDKDMSTTGGVNADYWKNANGNSTHIPWIWVEVLNFGGNTGMHGGARRFRNLAKIGTAANHSASFKGYGILSEGLETNPMMYDMFNDAFSRTVGQSSSIDDTKINQWVSDYCERRYGLVDDNLKTAYGVLLNTVFDCSRYQEGCVENIFCAPPDAAVSAVSKWGPKGGIEYDPAELYPAAYAFLDAAKDHPELLELETFRYDFVELFLQLLGERGRVINADIVTSGAKRNLFIKMLDLAERLTASSERWRLDWHEARTYTVSGSTDNYRGVRGYRRMVTCWCDGYAAGQATGLREYAHRAYAGLLKDYYAQRWFKWFDMRDGKITSAQYTAFLSALDDSFMTAELEPTPMGDLVALGEEILETLNPPALTLDATTAAVNWTESTWIDAKGQESVWIDDYDVNLSGVCTVSATSAVNVGSLTIGPSKRSDVAIYSGYLPVGAANAVKLFANLSAEDRENVAYFRGTMNGGWVAAGEAKSYQMNDGDEYLEMQMQRIDDGYLKSVRVRTYFNPADGCIWGYAVDAGNINGGVLGANVTGTGTSVATTDTANGYGIKEFAAILNSDITLSGAINVSGTLTVSGGKLTLNSATQASAPSEIKIDNGTLILESAVGTAALRNVTIGAGGKLVIMGELSTLSKISFTGSVLPKGEIILLNGEEEIPLEVLSDGSLKVKLAAQTFEGEITTTWTNLGWKNLTCDDLLVCEFISSGNRATDIKIAEGDRSNQIQMTINGTVVYLSASGNTVSAHTASGSITGLQLNPAEAQVVSSKTNYATIDAALSAANSAGSEVKALKDATVSAPGSYTNVDLVIPAGVIVNTDNKNFLWNASKLHFNVYGTLDFGSTPQSVGPNSSYDHVINLYAGGRIVSSHEQGFSIFNDMTINVLADPSGKATTATLDIVLQARGNVTLNVASGVTLVQNGNLTSRRADDSGNVNAKVYKTGAGTLEFNGMIAPYPNYTLELIVSEGTLARALANEELFTATINGGSANITSSDEDYEVVEPAAAVGNVHTWKSQGILWLFFVTKPGETGQNGEISKKFQHLTDAVTWALDLRTKNPGKTVKLWAVVQNEVEAKKEIAAAGYPDPELSPNGLEVIGWDEPVRYYYMSGDVSKKNWTTADTVTGYRGSSVVESDHTITAGDIIMFDKSKGSGYTEGKLGYLYIDKNIVCTEIDVVNETTIQLGYWSGTHSIPVGWTVNVGKGSQVLFNNDWKDGQPVKVPEAQFNGEGTISFGSRITSDSEIVFGKIKGTATITIPSGLVVKQADENSFIENPLAGSGTLIVKNVNFAYTLAEGSEVKFEVDSTVDGNWRYVKNGNIVTFVTDIVRAWHQGEGAAIGTTQDNLTELLRGITIDELKNGGEYELRAELGGAWMSPALLSHAVLFRALEGDWHEAQFQVIDKDGDGHPILKYANVKFAAWNQTVIKGYQSGQGYVSDASKLGKEWVEQTSGNPSNTEYQIKSFAAAIHRAVDNTQTWNEQPEDLIREDVVVLGPSAKLTVNYAIKNHISGTGTIVTTVAPSSDLVMALQYQNWKGTAVLDGLTVNGINPSSYGNANSVVELKNCTGYFAGNGSSDGTLRVTGTLNITNGYGGQTFTLAKLMGDGTINLNKTGLVSFHTIKVMDASEWTGTINEASGNSVKIVFASAKVGDTIYFTAEEAIAAAGPDATIEILRSEPTQVITVKYSTQKIRVHSGFTGNFTLDTTEPGLWYKTADLEGDGTSLLYFVPGTDQAFDKTWTNVYLGPTMVDTANGDWSISTDWANKSGKVLVRDANGRTPYISGKNSYQSALVDGNNLRHVLVAQDGKKHVSADTLDGWDFCIGAVNDMVLTIENLTKFQSNTVGLMGIYADESSKVIVSAMNSSSNCNRDTGLHVASEDGIVFKGFKTGSEMQYFIEGDGSVAYELENLSGKHVIKAIEIDIGKGEGKILRSRKIASFTSASETAAPTFTAAAGAITYSDGTTAASSDDELTTSMAHGTYKLRVGDDGLYIDYVGRRSLYNEWRPIEDNNWSTAANWSWGEVPESGATMVKVIGGEDEAVDLVCPSAGTTYVEVIHMEGVVRLSGKLTVGKLAGSDELRIAADGDVFFTTNYVGFGGTNKIVFEASSAKITNASWPAIDGEVTVVVEEGVTATFFNAGCIYGSANGKVIKQGFGTLKFGMEFGRASRGEKDWLKNLKIQEGIVEINAGCVENVYGDGKLKATTAKATNLTVKSLQAIMMIDMGTHTDGQTTLSTITMAEGADLDLACSDNCCLTYEINGDKHPVVSSGEWGFLGTVSGDTGTWDYSAVTIVDSDLKTSATTKTRTIGNQGFKYTLAAKHDEVKISIVVDLKADNQGKMLISVGYATEAGAPSNFANLMYTTDGKLLLTHTQSSTTTSNTGATEVISGKHLVTMVCSKTNGTKLLVDGEQKATDAGITWGTKTQAPCGIIRFGSWADSGVHQGTEKATWYHATGTRYYSACIDCAGESGSASATAKFRLPAAFSEVSELEKAHLTMEYLNGSNGRVEVPGAYSIEGSKVITDIAKIEEMETLLGKNTGKEKVDLSMPFVPAEQTGDVDSVSIAVNLSAELKGGKLVLVTSTTPNGEMTEVEGQVKTTPKAGTQTFTLDSITESMSTGKVLYFKVKAEPNNR